ncbi:MAG TPA: alpha/beta hydrolase [Usitatibacter sp.]|nr:alpha/beta hydrolase [Usitatibacter sp.]
MTEAGVARRAAYFGEGAHPFFGWYHEAPGAPARDCVAVLCAPVGHEYTRVHRTLRHLADRFARAGMPCVRFDYHGIGDSPGTDLDPGRVAAWTSNVAAACERARAMSGRSRVCLVGVRLGAALAALASSTARPDLLVLWNPVVKGRGYVRELQAIAKMAAQAADAGDVLEAAGFVMTAETLDAVKSLDLFKQPLHARRVLIVNRDDAAPDAAFASHLASIGIATDSIAAPGWPGMVADHQFTVVPDAALSAIVAWAEQWGQTPVAPAPGDAGKSLGNQGGGEGQWGQTPRFVGSDPSWDVDGVREHACAFGEGGKLFGVLTRPQEDAERPAIVMFNAGAVHHVGPNRVYVTLARSLAKMGFACFRFDLEGIGDSVLEGGGRENHPYPPHATRDAKAALRHLRERFGFKRFVALGICAGAHTAFHSALKLEEEDLGELILINPLTFYWREGDSIESVAHFADVQAYKKSMRDPNRWLKLLRGDVNIGRLLEVALNHPKAMARSYYDAFRETVMPSRAPRLSRDLRALFDRNRHVTVLVAEGDPGRDILMSEAKVTTSRAIRGGQMHLEMLPGADHTFTRARVRRELAERVGRHLAQERPAARP